MTHPAPYSLQLSPALWRQVGAMRREDFERLQRALAHAQAAGVLHPVGANEVVPGGQDPVRPVGRVNLEGFVLVFARDEERRTLTLLQVEGLPGEQE